MLYQRTESKPDTQTENAIFMYMHTYISRETQRHT